MKNIQTIEFQTGSKEELLPGFTPDFPYIASRVELDKFMERSVPWHWHRTVELFYVENGALIYHPPPVEPYGFLPVPEVWSIPIYSI